ncbi:MAG: hypothetical protein H6672_08540 [Anaerolineaceae bacterium]|nr:hypothetical protein [Anaerolineaceae bacterium]
MNASSEIRSKIRQQIRPFRHERLFPTGWAGELSFAEIRTDLLPNLTRLLRYYKRPEAFVPDMLQEGFLHLWWDLSQNSDLLAKANKGDALRLVLDRSRPPTFVRRSMSHEVYLDDLATRSGDPDAFIIEGYEGRYYTEHSEFSRAIDIRIDFEWVIRHLAEKYMDSFPHLVALYYITTEVTPDDAASLAGRSGTKKAWWLTSVVKPVREELAELLGVFIPTKLGWKQKFISGDETPFWQVVETFKNRQAERMVAVLEGMAEHESCHVMAARLEMPMSSVFMYRRQAHEALRKAYRCPA